MSFLGKFVGFWGGNKSAGASLSGKVVAPLVSAPEPDSSFEPKLVLIVGDTEACRHSLHAQLTTAHHGQLTSFDVMDAPDDVLSAYLKGTRLPDAALLLVDATQGVGEEMSRLTQLLSLLDIGAISVAVMHMADVDHEEDQFTLIAEEVTALAATFGVSVSACLPVSDLPELDAEVTTSLLDWYEGPSLVDSIAGLRPRAFLQAAPLRVRVTSSQIVDDRRVLSGQLLSGAVRPGDDIIFSPSNKRARIHSAHNPSATAFAMDESVDDISIGLTDDGFVEAGQILSHSFQLPIETDVFRARLMNFGAKGIAEGHTVSLIFMGGIYEAIVQKVEHVVDLGDGTLFGERVVGKNQVAELVLRTRSIIALDENGAFEGAGYLTIESGDGAIEAAGLISMAGYADQRSLITPRSSNITLVKQSVSADERAHRNTHKGGVLWFTGLSGAGKSTLAVGLEQALFKQGFHTALLDGDNVRHGLNANLGFSPEDRAENIRRVGEVAALFQQSGILVMASFISPYRSDRERARDAAADGFHEIYIKADVETCIERDPKGLYQRALAGEILDFTGISAPYEVPEQADLIVDTGKLTVEQSIALLVDYVNTHFKV